MNNIKRIVSTIVFVFWMVSCSSQHSLSNKIQYEKCVDAFCLLDPEGFNAKIPDAEDYFVEGQIVLVDKGRQQYLRMTRYPGDPMGVMSVFEIGYLSDLDSCLYHDYDGAFLTNNHVSLGALEDDIEKLQGSPSWIEEKDGCKIYYYWEDESSSDFVRENNEYAYFIEYWMKDGMLAKLQFGFEYP